MISAELRTEIRRLFFGDIDDLREAHSRPCSQDCTLTVAEDLEHERPSLLCLPGHPNLPAVTVEWAPGAASAFQIDG